MLKYTNNMGKWFKKLFLCKILGLHSWTSTIQKKGFVMPENPTNKDLAELSKMYCGLCGKMSIYNDQLSEIFFAEHTKDLP